MKRYLYKSANFTRQLQSSRYVASSLPVYADSKFPRSGKELL